MVLFPEARAAVEAAAAETPVWTEGYDIAAARAANRAAALAEPREDVAEVRRPRRRRRPGPALPARRRDARAWSSTCTAAGSSSTTSTCTTPAAAGSRTAPGSRCSASTTGGRPSTGSRPPPTTWTRRWPGWTREATTLGVDGPAYVHGDSAGGNLALVAALRHPGRFAAAVLIYPFLDPTRRLRRPTAPAAERLRPARGRLVLGAVRRARPPTSTTPTSRRCAPTGSATLPPTLVVTAEHDPLRDEGEELARLLAEAGRRGDRDPLPRAGARLLAPRRGVPGRRAADAAGRRPSSGPSPLRGCTPCACTSAPTTPASTSRPTSPTGSPSTATSRSTTARSSTTRSTTTRSSACAPPRAWPRSGPQGLDSLGVVIGGSGNGEQIAANKVAGIRCALAWSEETAALGPRAQRRAGRVGRRPDALARGHDPLRRGLPRRPRSAATSGTSAGSGRWRRTSRPASCRRCRSPPRVAPSGATVPEGHTLHRLATALDDAFAGHRSGRAARRAGSPSPPRCSTAGCWVPPRRTASTSSSPSTRSTSCTSISGCTAASTCTATSTEVPDPVGQVRLRLVPATTPRRRTPTCAAPPPASC